MKTYNPELIITEILDDNDLPVIDGESGELTITTLGVEAMPLLRFKTGDIVKIHTETCSCGRNTLEKTVKLTTTFQSKLTIDFGAN